MYDVRGLTCIEANVTTSSNQNSKHEIIWYSYVDFNHGFVLSAGQMSKHDFVNMLIAVQIMADMTFVLGQGLQFPGCLDSRPA